MKRIILFSAMSIFTVLFISGCAVADSQLRYFRMATNGDMMRLDVFASHLRFKLALNDYQCTRIEDILSDSRDQVIIIRRGHFSEREYERWCNSHYRDTDRRIIALLTPAQLREYKHWRGDVHNWIHEQKEWRNDERHDGFNPPRRAEQRDRHDNNRPNDRPGDRRDRPWN